MIYTWWCSTTFQNYSLRTLGKNVLSLRDRFWKAYCIAPALTWINSIWSYPWGHDNCSSCKSTKWYSNSSEVSYTLLSKSIKQLEFLKLCCSPWQDVLNAAFKPKNYFWSTHYKMSEWNKCHLLERRIFQTHDGTKYFRSFCVSNSNTSLATTLIYTTCITNFICCFVRVWILVCHIRRKAEA